MASPTEWEVGSTSEAPCRPIRAPSPDQRSCVPSDLESVFVSLASAHEAKTQHDINQYEYAKASTKYMETLMSKVRSQVEAELGSQAAKRDNLEALLHSEREKYGVMRRNFKTEVKVKRALSIKLKSVKADRDRHLTELAEERKQRWEAESQLTASRAQEQELNKELGVRELQKFDLIDKLSEERDERFEAQSMYEDMARKKRKLEADYNSIQAEKFALEDKQQHLEAEKTTLQETRRTLERNLDDEAQKRICQICLSALKDTIAFPCLHLSYCFKCLDRHRKRSNFCPKCRGPLNGVLKCYIDMD